MFPSVLQLLLSYFTQNRKQKHYTLLSSLEADPANPVPGLHLNELYIHECNFDAALDVLRSANRDLILGNLSITVVLPENANDLSVWALKDR
jgi:hypothetical protein